MSRKIAIFLVRPARLKFFGIKFKYSSNHPFKFTTNEGKQYFHLNVFDRNIVQPPSENQSTEKVKEASSHVAKESPKEEKKEKSDKKKATWSSYFKKWITYGVLTTVAISSVNYQEIFSEKKAIETIKKGSVDLSSTVDTDLLSLKEDIKTLKEHLPIIHRGSGIVNPAFVVVTGRKGGGKSTVSEHLAKELGSNVIYIQFHKDMKESQIVETIAKAIRYYPYMNRNDLPFVRYITTSLLEIVRPNKPTFSDMTKVIKEITTTMSKESNGVIPYLIFDNVDALAKQDNNMLVDLVEFSKEGSSKRLFGTVMFANEDSYKIIKGTSGHSGITRTHYLHGIPKKEASTYIINHMTNNRSKEKNTEIANTLIDSVCGDHLLSIVDVIADINQNKPVYQIVSDAIHETKYNLRGYELGQIINNSEAFAVWNLLDYMYKNGGECSRSEASFCLGPTFSKHLLDTLVKRDIIASTSRGSLIFYNAAVKTLIGRVKSKRSELFSHFIEHQPSGRLLDFEE